MYCVFQRLVRICGEVRASPAETDEVLFLCTLCSKLKADPYLVSFFAEVSVGHSPRAFPRRIYPCGHSHPPGQSPSLFTVSCAGLTVVNKV